MKKAIVLPIAIVALVAGIVANGQVATVGSGNDPKAGNANRSLSTATPSTNNTPPVTSNSISINPQVLPGILSAGTMIFEKPILPAIFSTAIADIISWALFAIFCSLLHEAIVQMLAERERFMRHYLERQLFDRANGINWASALYLHGSLDLLIRDNKKAIDHVTTHEVVSRRSQKGQGYLANEAP